MTPQEKAKELIDKFDLPSGLMSIERKQCALITVDEIMTFPKTLLYYIHFHRFRKIDVYSWKDEDSIIVDKMTALEYWNKVKQEIEKL